MRIQNLIILNTCSKNYIKTDIFYIFKNIPIIIGSYLIEDEMKDFWGFEDCKSK